MEQGASLSSLHCFHNMIPFYICCSLLVSSIKTSYADQDAQIDTLFPGKRLREGQSLSSANNTFALRFSNMAGGYLAIVDSYYSHKVVWVANTNNPVQDSSRSLMIDPNDGMLKIFYTGGSLLVSNASTSLAKSIGNSNTSATILDSGNLVLRKLNSDGSINSTLWQSFDYPTDTLLPGMKLGINFRTGHEWSLTSWMTTTLPASGIFTLRIDPNGTNQLIMLWHERVYWTSGLLRDGRFDDVSIRICYNFSFTSNEDEKYFTYSLDCDDIDKARLTLEPDGRMSEGAALVDDCGNGKLLDEQCVRQELPECRTREGNFSVSKMDGHTIYGEGYKFPEDVNYFDCQAKCLANCSCVAFSVDESEMGCEMWRKLSKLVPDPIDNRRLYTFQRSGVTGRRKKWKIWVITVVAGVASLSAAILFYFVKRLKFKKKEDVEATERIPKQVLGGKSTSSKKFTADLNEMAIGLFSLETMIQATNDFSDANKLGEGGFGQVYKGKLLSGQDVAIKRLSRNSGQGLVEFKNEVLLIAKLQHTNLVKLVGSCIQGQESILVYEYMSNGSLDHFLFDSSKQGLLNCAVRMRIVEGVAQGLLYLHNYSRLKVIHRDLKAANILLDHNMNPKISDFGMARIFETQESEEKTRKIVGTYGYMSPEYMINGMVSLETDVFSFGVLLLEIVSGKKNRDNYNTDRPLNLIGLAWELWVEGRAMELVDSSIDDHLDHKQALVKCIHIGLLCVQNSPADRPSMMDVVSMLTNESMQLPIPKQPAFFMTTNVEEMDNKETISKRQSLNELSISLVEAR